MDEEAPKKVRKVFLLTPRMIEMIKEIKVENGLNTDTAVVYLAINELYRKVKPAYVTARREQSGRTPEERAENQMKIAEYKKKKEEDKLMAIVEALEGKTIPGENGSKIVHYYTYDRNNRYLQEMPLTMMTDELVANQYFPSKEEVKQRQAEGKVNYTISA